ncbi:hypothetical protein P879_09601 [Paragonimus westermani]|uniref:Uncharacterized protein n=1 Tax=Paragonimus westermani TaxID=34504 RepID=A0A8T0DGL0_9TREM|nr:hypothetical protein P879_09601 [Paragonimus westermani]
MPPTRKIPDVDLRQKLSSSIRSLDARSVIRNRRRSRVFTNRDARNILQKRPRATARGTSSRVPFMVPVKTVKNDLFAQNPLNRARVGVVSFPIDVFLCQVCLLSYDGVDS